MRGVDSAARGGYDGCTCDARVASLYPEDAMTPRRSLASHRSITALLALACLLGASLAPRQAAAQDKDLSEEELTLRVEELSGQGVEHYANGRYREAIAAFEQAYKLAPVGNLLYNIGLSWEKLDELPQAVKAYERFIVASDADPGVRSKALDRIKTLNEELERRAAAERQAEEDRRQAELKNKPDPDPQPAPSPSDGGLGGLGVAGIVTASGGLLLLGGGVFFGLAAQDSSDDFAAARTTLDKDAARADAEDSALLADIFYGVGGAALIGGVVLLAIDLASDEQAPQPTGALRLAPWIGDQSAGAALGGSF